MLFYANEADISLSRHIRCILIIPLFHFSDSFLSLSSALTVLKQEIPSPFGSDQVKKIAKALPLNKEQVDEISQIDQTAASATIKNGCPNNVAGTNNANTITCHLNGNSNSSASNELVNCLENVAQQQQPNDQIDDHNDSNNLSTKCFPNSFI